MDNSSVSWNQTSLSQIYEWTMCFNGGKCKYSYTNINTKYFTFWKPDT